VVVAVVMVSFLIELKNHPFALKSHRMDWVFQT
jgi:hypothetical protein